MAGLNLPIKQSFYIQDLRKREKSGATTYSILSGIKLRQF
jgi:hypothetical protein